jgi:uncharacterized protein (DUF2141 family)
MLLLLLWLFLHAPNPDLTIRISNIQEARGVIRVAVFNQATGFLETEKACFVKVAEVGKSASVDITFPNAPAGTYAVSCFHDLNNNGKLDKNMLGVPTEPYGFSNQARPTFRAPSWDEARVRVDAGKALIPVRLEKW